RLKRAEVADALGRSRGGECERGGEGEEDRSDHGPASERRYDVEEAGQPPFAARALDRALAGVSDLRVGNPRRGDAVVLVDVGQANDAGELDPLLALAELHDLLTFDQSGSVGPHF